MPRNMRGQSRTTMNGRGRSQSEPKAPPSLKINRANRRGGVAPVQLIACSKSKKRWGRLAAATKKRTLRAAWDGVVSHTGVL